MINDLKIGIIGYGNMGQAMATGWVEHGGIQPDNVFASARNIEKLQRNCEKIGIQPLISSAELVEYSDIVVLAVKPYQIADITALLKEQLKNKIVLCVAAGINYVDLSNMLAEGTAHISLVPNTPVSIGEGISVVENMHSLDDSQLDVVDKLLSMLGLVQYVETTQMSVAGTLAGCGPAFTAMYIEALADGAVKHGLNRADAYRLASQMIVGTGKMQLETNEHPGIMKDAVTSPGGTTIKGVTALEEYGFRNAVIKALDAIENK